MSEAPAIRRDPLDFDQLRAVNIARSARWHPGGIADWSLADWAVAAAGEMGEVCEVVMMLDIRPVEVMTLSELGVAAAAYTGTMCDAVKKLNSVRDGLVGNRAAFDDLRNQVRSAAGIAGMYLHQMSLRMAALKEPDDLRRERRYGRAATDRERARLGQEIADTVIYLDDLAERGGIDLGAAVTVTFNAVSDRNGFPEKL
jgi:hypothetical protein